MGLAWTAMGGSTLFIECVRTPTWQPPEQPSDDSSEGASATAGGGGSIRGTGQLGDVMKESLTIAHSFARRYLDLVEPTIGMLATDEIHIHVRAPFLSASFLLHTPTVAPLCHTRKHTHTHTHTHTCTRDRHTQAVCDLSLAPSHPPTHGRPVLQSRCPILV